MKRNPPAGHANRILRCGKTRWPAAFGYLAVLLFAGQLTAQQQPANESDAPVVGAKRIFPREALWLPLPSERLSVEAEPAARRPSEERPAPAASSVATGVPDRTTTARDQGPSRPNTPDTPPKRQLLDQSYTLAENDYVNISVYQEPDLETKARVDKDGMIEFPLLGTIRIGGKTVREAAAHIRNLLQQDYLVNPQVSLSLIEYSKRQFTILGEVQNPGTFNLPDDRPLTLLQAVGLAGGFAPSAKKDKIIVTRIVGGENTNYKVDATAFARDKNARPFFILPDDHITVPERFF